jgi:glutamate synthase (ferredoxin)
MGCIMMRACHLNTCPVGIATQDPTLRARFTGDPSHVVNFMEFVAQEVRELMAQLGCRNFNELIGRSDLLEIGDVDHWKARGLDLSQILFRPELPETVGRFQQVSQSHSMESTFDARVLLDLCRPALSEGQPVDATLAIRNTDRAVGTRLGSELTKQYGSAGMPDDSIRLNFKGSAGQSFGAFIPKGITLRLEGDANDYVGKGLSGGRIVVFPPVESAFTAEENIIIGNVAFYGATKGDAYINGVAGERFCVRNSGAHVVVEAVGDHGCEYMTGGRVVVLGKTGRNFAAGMSGGIAYVVDDEDSFSSRCNLEMVSLTRLEDAQEVELVKDMIFRHAELTLSSRAAQLLFDWEQSLKRIVRVMPKDLQRVLEEGNQQQFAETAA